MTDLRQQLLSLSVTEPQFDEELNTVADMALAINGFLQTFDPTVDDAQKIGRLTTLAKSLANNSNYLASLAKQLNRKMQSTSLEEKAKAFDEARVIDAIQGVELIG